VWKLIPDTEGRYEARTTGEIRSVPISVEVCKNGSKDTLTVKGKVLPKRRTCQNSTSLEYEFVSLKVGGRFKRLAVHTLILRTFVGPCPEGYRCVHLDGNSLNNHINNLAWKHPSEDMGDPRPVQENEGLQNTLTSEDILAIRVMSRRGMSFPQLTEWFRTDPDTIEKIVNGDSCVRCHMTLKASSWTPRSGRENRRSLTRWRLKMGRPQVLNRRGTRPNASCSKCGDTGTRWETYTGGNPVPCACHGNWKLVLTNTSRDFNPPPHPRTWNLFQTNRSGNDS
jgi:hypothetical protein